jgi:glycosyltransferase involved in cell wall biosynthesis
MVPLISVCIVTYNHQAYIADCLNSVLAQYGNFRLEILIGDDTSSDNTAAIIQKIKNQYQGDISIHLFTHEMNLGPAKNYQYLIKKAQGEFIAHLDGDDFWLPGKVQTQLQFLRNTPDCPACYTNAIVIRDDKSYWGFFNPTQITQRLNTKILLKNGNFLNHSSLLYRAEYKHHILAFPDFIDYHIHLQLSLNGSLGYINQVLTAYRVNSATSQLIKMKASVLRLYVDALLEMKAHTTPIEFKEAIRAFYRVYFLNLHLNYDAVTRRDVLAQLQSHYPLNRTTVIFTILPFTVWSELKSWLYKKTIGRQLRFLQRNGAF